MLSYSSAMARILLIDDDPYFREVMAKLLGLHQFSVLQASNGLEGIQLQRIHQAEVVICDVKMPGMDGRDVMVALRALTPAARIIAISGAAEFCVKRWSASVSAADRTLSKPFSHYELIEAVESLLTDAPRAEIVPV